MLISVVVRTKDEAPRLRLVLASLSRQSVPFVPPGAKVAAGAAAAESIVVNDGSTDQTPAALEEASASLPLLTVHHRQALGRCAASNAGARAATGDVLLFLDGDTVAGPRCVKRHSQTHDGSARMARGETYHLRCTRFFLDPETGTAQPGQEERVGRLASDLERHLVTRRQVLDQFEEIERRAEVGIYPGAGPRKLAELELDALRNHPELSVLWMAASGNNLSVRRRDFEAVGGFDERLDYNEHRELAFRLMARDVRLVLAEGARTYHLTHRSGWPDPLTNRAWERIFYEAHPCLAVKLMPIFWMSIGGVRMVPEEARITSLPHMDALVRAGTTFDYDSVRLAL